MQGKVVGRILFVCIWPLSFLLGCSSNTGPAPVTVLNSPKDYSEIKRGSLKAKNYIVKKGDTLYSISWQSGMDFRELASLNNISEPYQIYPGQELRLSTSKKRQTKNLNDQASARAKKQPNQTVDRQKKQAYGGKTATENVTPTEFADRVKRWRWPAQGKVMDSFSGAEVRNKGIGINGRRGSPITAAADGKVVYKGNALRGYGNLIIIKHTETYLSAYAHTQNIKVKEQQWVKAGQQIAQMGSDDSGEVLLHFEVRYRGKSVDPLRYLPKR